MTERERIEEQIRAVLAAETCAFALSEKLFAPGGLFSQLAANEEERRRVADTPLFRQAQQRLSALQRDEAADFLRALQQSPPSASGECRVKLEPART